MEATSTFLPKKVMDSEAWRATVHEVAKCQIQLITHVCTNLCRGSRAF